MHYKIEECKIEEFSLVVSDLWTPLYMTDRLKVNIRKSINTWNGAFVQNRNTGQLKNVCENLYNYMNLRNKCIDMIIQYTAPQILQKSNWIRDTWKRTFFSIMLESRFDFLVLESKAWMNSELKNMSHQLKQIDSCMHCPKLYHKPFLQLIKNIYIYIYLMFFNWLQV